MPADMDSLLERAAAGPSAPLDPEAVWRRGRRRRRRRQLAAGGSIGVAGALAVVLALTVVPASDPPGLEIDAAGGGEQPDDAGPSAPTATDGDAEGPDTPQQQAADSDDGSSATDDGAVAPEPALLEEPCAPRASRDGMAPFVDVVAPVEGQTVSEAIELVGCASVFEATVRYRLSAADGTVLVDDHTTASAGGPEMGAFETRVPLDGATGELTLEVFWESPADGSEQDATSVTVTTDEASG